jgi:NAD(P)-dependent dehydrogenase (short-subunit alcohol dehydrogenase family)
MNFVQANPVPAHGALNSLLSGFKGAIVVVIGGRGGIGQAVVAQCLDLGARVIVVSSTCGEGHLDLSPWEASRPSTIRANVCDSNALRMLALEIEAKVGRIDILVNSAGSSTQIPLKALDRLSDELIQEVFNANAMSVIASIRELTPLLKKGVDPVIVNIGSIAAWTGMGSNLAYVGAKAAVQAMSIGLAKALAPEIRVVGIAPSALETGFVKQRSQLFLDATISATPLGRLTTVTEVASAVLCAARILTATTGVTIAVDGGRHL